ncbi:ATP-dependent RecD-like DNA helicase [Paucibacter sp. B2R-40]|uniref:ATP-dependent RecD-like DNA helicase n=1 Tax=Paucibacter sp. B2R-40 TaxID=2893554 RepID=UPI0021E3BE01|nr:ATP-dependent RecD-like DNA helicase [Paucibacter sp. B2R-40]MCV2353570.1 ATP-dependent RecD-like DNA helicase [Paucibacter sp. B2R-40]
MSVVQVFLRVTSVRSRGAAGGAIFAGKTDLGESYVVVVNYALLGDSSLVERAQVWSVEGEAAPVSYTVDGIVRSEVQIRASQVALQRPSGKNLVAWIAQSSECIGIGEVRARRLWETFGTDLPALIESANIAALAPVVGEEPARTLVAAFEKHGIAQVLLWLDQLGLPRALGASVARYWGKDARVKVGMNPYVLVSFCADWKTVDDLAQKRFEIGPDDSRRLIAAVEEALYRAMDRGDTALPCENLKSRLRLLLGNSQRAELALSAALGSGVVTESAGLVQAKGLAHIEETIAARLKALQAGRGPDQDELFTVDLPRTQDVQNSVALYESLHSIELTPEQREAILTSATNRVSLILGGAGTGKTTVLKALCQAIDQVTPGATIHQIALAGRAAQRMTQATGRPSKTIAAFLLDDDIAPGSTVLLDEASMVDVILMYRLLRHIPAVRLVLIGDPSQLPPIGPGLVLHALVGQPSIPQTLLKTVKRQTAASGIPMVAKAVRDHCNPEWAPYVGKGTGVSVVPCSEGALDATVANIYSELGGTGQDFSVQVLSTTRSGAGGIRALNDILHSRFAPKAQPVCSHSNEFGSVNERTADQLSLFVGDLVLFGSNDYTLGLRNGALGCVSESLNPASADEPVCRAEFEGVPYELTAAHVRHVIHAYAMTIHKAQGSQFERVIVPIRYSRILDNSLLYTAITRAIGQVVLVGDIRAAEQAILAPSSASLRTTRLQALMQCAETPPSRPN